MAYEFKFKKIYISDIQSRLSLGLLYILNEETCIIISNNFFRHVSHVLKINLKFLCEIGGILRQWHSRAGSKNQVQESSNDASHIQHQYFL